MSIPRIATYPMPIDAGDNRVPWQPDAARAALLVHDMQDYFLDFYDRRSAPVPALIAHVRRLVDLAHAQGIPVIYTAQRPEQSAAERGLLEDMWGPGLTAHPQRAAIAADVAPGPDDHVLDKWRYSAFQRSPLLELMRQYGRDQLIICGVYAHIGCLMSAAEAFMHDIQAFLVADAVADFSAADHALAMAWVGRRCGRTLLTQTLVDALGACVPESLDALRRLIAERLEIPAGDLHAEDNLLDWGMDSIRLMTLVEQWRAVGCAVDFTALAEQPTLAAWWELLQRESTAQTV